MDKKAIESYEKIGISLETIKLLNDKLKLPNIKLTSYAKEMRLKALKEAISWESGPDQQHRKVTILYNFGEYSVAIGKPGKEADPDYKNFTHYITKERGNNPHDMNPQILRDNKKVGKDYTFEDMFEHIEHLMHSDLFGLELLGSLLFRAAFMLDHKEDRKGNLRYSPPKEVVEILKSRIGNVEEIPVEVFLHFLEVLSLNEDIKVNQGGYGEFTKDYGRINTLLTFVHLIAVLLNRKSLAKFAGSFARPPSGMAPISKTERGGIFNCFPLLSPELFGGNKKLIG